VPTKSAAAPEAKSAPEKTSPDARSLPALSAAVAVMTFSFVNLGQSAQSNQRLDQMSAVVKGNLISD
jgi:hypothetical protein